MATVGIRALKQNASAVVARAPDATVPAAGANPIAGPSVDTMAQRRDVLLERFRVEASGAFLDAYREAAAAAPRPWVDSKDEEALLALFLIEKAAYEVCYEAANRPAWIGVPLRGLVTLAGRIEPAIRREENLDGQQP